MEADPPKYPTFDEIKDACQKVGRDNFGIMEDPELLEVLDKDLSCHPPRLAEFIIKLVDDGWISSETRDRALILLALLPEEPQIAPGPDGMLGFNWRNQTYYCSLELMANGDLEFFQENLVNGELWSLDVSLLDPDYTNHLLQFITRVKNNCFKEKESS